MIPNPDQPSEEFQNPLQEIDLRRYWQILLERRWLVISVFLLTLLLTAIYLARATKIYSATARIQINRESENILNMKDAFSMDGREIDYLNTQYKNLQSYSILQKVAMNLHLKDDSRYTNSADIALALNQDITIIPVRLSRLVDVKVEHSNPQSAAKIANAIATTFITNNLAQKSQASVDAVTWLTNQVEDSRLKVAKSEAAVHAYLTNYNEVSLEEGENIVRQGLLQAKADVSKASSLSTQAARTITEIDNILNAGKPLESIPQVAENPTVQRLKQEVAVKDAALAASLKRYRDKHPTIIQARSEIANLRDSLLRECETVLQTIRNNSQIYKKQEEVLQKLVVSEEKKQLQLNQLRIQYSMLKRESENNKTIYNNVLVRMKETELTSKLTSNNMRLVDQALIPLNPVKPRVMITLVFGMFAGAAMALGLAMFVNYLDDTVRSQDDVEVFLRLPFLGYVSHIKANSVVARDLQAHLDPQSNSTEGFRTVRASLSLAKNSDQHRVIAITSAIPGEGKSLVASNLAIVLAQSGFKTVLVETDLRRPTVHKAFQLHGSTGLVAYLTNEVETIEEMVQKTEVPNLDAITCGLIPSSPAELIGSSRMLHFLEELQKKYDRIILDCPPVSAVSDPLVIGAMADGIVFVSKFNKVRRNLVRKVVQRIQSAGINILGVVVNDIDFEGRDSYYYSYYYYQNRYYASYKTDPDKTNKKSKPDNQELSLKG